MTRERARAKEKNDLRRSQTTPERQGRDADRRIRRPDNVPHIPKGIGRETRSRRASRQNESRSNDVQQANHIPAPSHCRRRRSRPNSRRSRNEIGRRSTHARKNRRRTRVGLERRRDASLSSSLQVGRAGIRRSALVLSLLQIAIADWLRGDVEISRIRIVVVGGGTGGIVVAVAAEAAKSSA